LYDAYEAQAELLAPLQAIADITRSTFGSARMGPAFNFFFSGIAAGAEIVSRARLNHEHPGYDIAEAEIDGRTVPVFEETLLDTPFGALLHFRKETNLYQPRVLIVAPMAGHFATLLRHTARTMLNDHDVYITDWKNARDVPLTEGSFGVD